MKLCLTIVSSLMVAPLVAAMIGLGPPPGGLGHNFGVSNAIWLALGLMAAFVALCAVILRIDTAQPRR